MEALKITPDATPQPYTALRSTVAQACWDSVLAAYDDWQPDALMQLANMANDCAIVAECDEAMGDPDLAPLELTRLDLRRDRAIKRFNRARQCLNLDVAPVEARPPISASRYLGAG